jgi:hypothetical protein
LESSEEKRRVILIVGSALVFFTLVYAYVKELRPLLMTGHQILRRAARELGDLSFQTRAQYQKPRFRMDRTKKGFALGSKRTTYPLNLPSGCGGDRGSADWQYFGWPAGFTNQKKERRLENSLRPFVNLCSCEERVYSAASEFLPNVEALGHEYCRSANCERSLNLERAGLLFGPSTRSTVILATRVIFIGIVVVPSRKGSRQQRQSGIETRPAGDSPPSPSSGLREVYTRGSATHKG